MQVVQTHLTQPTPIGVNHTVAWLPVRSDVRKGSVVSLDKDPRDRWTVQEQGVVLEQNEIQRGWGLSLPRSQRTER
jgi:hypothetical protein